MCSVPLWSLCLGCSPVSRSIGMCVQKTAEDRKDQSLLSRARIGHKTWFPVATHKPNSSCFCIWTKQGKSYQTSQHVGDVFLTAGALLMRNLFLHAKQLNCIATGRFCNVWGSNSIENTWNDSRIRNGWFTITTHTAPSVQQISADKNKFVVPYSPYSPKLAPCDFFLFTKIKQQLWGRYFWDVPEIHHCQHMPRNSLPAWTEMLILMHKLRRRILWNVSVYFIIKSLHIMCKECRRFSWKIQTATVYLKSANLSNTIFDSHSWGYKRVGMFYLNVLYNQSRCDAEAM